MTRLGGWIPLFWRCCLVFVCAVCGACGDDGDGGDGGPPGTWTLVGEGQPSALLSVWGASPDDVWVVGGREATDLGPVVWHYDGAAWEKRDTGQTNVDLWWVFGIAGGPVFFGGSNGTILRYQGGVFERMTTPGTDIVFGLWAASADDVWAVGGRLGGGNGFVWRNQGTEFQALAGLPVELAGGNVWKDTGRSATDVTLSASAGLTLHWDGAALVPETAGAPEDNLFSIACLPDVCIAAGATTTNGVLYEDDGSGWVSRVPTSDGPQWRGVAAQGTEAWAVGQFGGVIHRGAGGWTPDSHGLTTLTFHAAWVDGEGGLWAVGGRFDTLPTREGMLLYRGTRDIAALP